MRHAISSSLKWTLAAGLVCASLLAGCFPRAETGPPTLKLATWFGTAEARRMGEIVAALNRRHADQFRLELLNVPSDYQTKVDTLISGRVAPDLFFIGPGLISSYAHIGALVDLESRLRADRDMALDDYFPVAIESAKFKGRLHALPWAVRPLILYYNKDLFDAAGVPYPHRDWDWETFMRAGRQLTQKDARGRHVQWGFIQHQWPPLSIWVWQNGGEFIRPGTGEVTVGDAATIGGLDFVHRMLHRDVISPGYTAVGQMGIGGMIRSGKVAMFVESPADDADQQSGMRIGASELPRGRQRATFAWMPYLAVSAQTKDPDLAYLAWKAVLGELHRWQVVPPRRSLAARLDQLAPHKAYAKDAILASMAYARAPQDVPEASDWEFFYWERISAPLLRGEGSAAKIGQSAQARLSHMLEMRR